MKYEDQLKQTLSIAERLIATLEEKVAIQESRIEALLSVIEILKIK